MALLFCDSFDHYAGSSQFAGKWETSCLLVNGRRGTVGAQPSLTVPLIKNIGSRADLILGFAMFGSAPGGTIRDLTDAGTPIFKLWNDGITYLTLGISSDGKLRLSRGAYPEVSNSDGPPYLGGSFAGSTPLWTSAPDTLQFAQWNFVEFKVHFGYDDGAWHLKINGETMHQEAAQRTIPFGYVNDPTQIENRVNPEYVTQIAMFCAGSTADYAIDDFRVCDVSGAHMNDFIGDAQVDLIRPNGAGDLSDSDIVGTAPDATRWESQRSPDHGVTAVQLNATGDADLYDFEDLPYDAATIFGVQLASLARKADGGPARLALTNRSGAMDTDASPPKLSPSAGDVYGTVHGVLVEAADGPWTLARVQASQFGVRREVLT